MSESPKQEEARLAIEKSLSGCSAAEPFVLLAQGDSMEPEFVDGCPIIIQKDGLVKDGSYVIAVVRKELIFRQLSLVDGVYTLHALKEGFPVETISGLDDIEGVIVQRGGKKKDRKKYV
jgi:SOS-response transcriptional repressor LexA